MSHSFASPELSRLVNEQLATGDYATVEALLLAGQQALRELTKRQMGFREQLRQRQERLNRGDGVMIEDDEALGEFLDAIDAEVDAEMAKSQSESSRADMSCEYHPDCSLGSRPIDSLPPRAVIRGHRMARMNGVEPHEASWITRLVYWFDSR